MPTEPEYRQELALSNNNLGALLASLGERVKAEAVYRAALDLYERLAADFPAEPDYRSHLARSHNNLGVLLMQDPKKGAEAEAAYRTALGFQKRLADDFPSVPDYRIALAGTYINLGYLLVELDKGRDAEAAFRDAIAIQKRLADYLPKVPLYRNMLAGSYNNLGVVLKDQGKGEDAEAAYRAALEIRERLAADFPKVPDYAVDLGTGYLNLGYLVRDGGQPQASLDWYAKAISTLEPIVRAEPRLVEARESLRNAYWGRAYALIPLGRHAEALPDWDRVLELESGDYRNGFRIQRALTLARLHDHARATAEADELAQPKDVRADNLYYLACVYAVSSVAAGKDAGLPQADRNRLAERHAARAVEMLERAKAFGHFMVRDWDKERDFIEHLKKDTDLDPLRSRDDFQKLLRELQE
jgi:tetratricopeptide (TPR) repeat protein